MFGIASTVLLVGIWGRAVVVDTTELADTLSPLAAGDMVSDRLATWLETELVDAGVDGVAASVAADEVLAHPSVGPVLEELVAEGVEAAASGDPTGASVDVAAILLPASGQITTGLNEAGVPVSTEQVEAALSRLDPLVVRGPTDQPFVGASSPLAANLGTAAILGALLMLLSAIAYIAMSRDGGASIPGAAHPLRPRSPLVCGAATHRIVAGRSGGWKGSIQGEFCPAGELEMDGATDHRLGRHDRGDPRACLPPAGQTGGSVPLRRRAAHTPRSMTPVPMRMVFNHLVGRGSTRPERRSRNHAHPPIDSTAISGTSGW